MTFAATGTWGVARVSREVPVWQEGRDYRSSPVPVKLTVLRSEAGEFFVVFRGDVQRASFTTSARYSQEWTGVFTVEAPEYVARPRPTPEPTPIPVVAEDASLRLTLEPSATSDTGVDVTLEANHRIGDMALQLVLTFEGASRPSWTLNGKAIAAGESADLGWLRGYWEDLSGYRVRTLAGTQVRHWACEVSRDYRLTLDCRVGRTEDLPDLTNTEEATLWVWLADEDGYPRAYIRAERELMARFTIRVRFAGTDAYADHCWWERSAPTIGRVERLGCGGLTFDDLEAATSRGTLVLGGTNEDPDYFHTNIDSVRGDLLRCQRHQSSDAERSVWACEPW